MQLKFLKNITDSQNGEYPIAALAWSPNNKKIAIATCERTVLLFNEQGVKKDKFNTKPSDPNVGKKSYSITCLAFNSDSDTLAVGQSDNIVFVYRLGSGWDSKKVICNKFTLNAPCTCVYWITPTSLLSGSLDGKIRSLDCKTNKSASAWSSGSACVSLSGFGGLIVSGHIDGGLLSTNNHLLARHPVPPSALCVLENAVLVAGCDKRIVIYDNTGRPLSNFDFSKTSDQREFTIACASASGQAAIVGSYDRCHVIEWSSGQGKWTTGLIINIPGLYTVRAIVWSSDGSHIMIGGFTGATLIYEAMMKRWMCGTDVEAIRRGQGQITLRKLSDDLPPLTLQSFLGRNIHSVRIMGGEWYGICRTEKSLILCDLARSLSSEIPWTGSGERFFFQHAPVCLIYRAGELTLVEYGIDAILASVRTEFMNPHLISVRINEGDPTSTNNKKLAYLLDQKCVCVVDLMTGSYITQTRLDARVDWLELSETAHVLLLRDRRRRLLLLDISTGKFEIILSNVNFVQWVEGTDAVVAQTQTHLAVWYSIDDISSVELLECGSGKAAYVEYVGDKPRVLLQNGPISHITLDHARLKFCAALRSNNFEGCESYLNTLGDNPQANTLWQQLANKAMELKDLEMAMRCCQGLGDEAQAAFLRYTIKLGEKYTKETDKNGMESPDVRARLSILSYDLKQAERIYIDELKEPSKAITMYTTLYKWSDALAVAERLGHLQVTSLHDQYMNHLMSTGAECEAANLLATRGDERGALQLMLQAGFPSRAARFLRETPMLLSDRDCYANVLQALLKGEWWEQAAELCENGGESYQAMELYVKANSFAKAVQKARQIAPDKVTMLEQQWGEWLMEQRQWGAAVTHLIEAGDSRSALAAAVRAQQWAKALQIIQVIDDIESVQEYYNILADHFSSLQDWKTAEALWEAGGLIEHGARVLGIANQWNRGLNFVRRTLGDNAAAVIFQPEAERLKDEGNYKEAEKLYVGLGLTDEAMAMYEVAGRHTSLLRLVKKHRPQLLGAARRRVAQALRDEGRPRQAEQYFIEADDWKGAIQMYRAMNQWEDAYRIAQQHASLQIQEQVIVAWSNSLEDDGAAAKVLSTHGVLEAGIRWAARGGNWSRALALCQVGAPQLEAPVRAQMAAHLEDEGKLEEAESEFIKGGGAAEAVDMWLHAQQHARALSLAEQHAPEKEGEVLQAYAEWAEAQDDLPLYEALVIRAGRPQDIIKYYKDNFMWDDAIRVCEEYLPQGVRALREEASRAGNANSTPSSSGFNPIVDNNPENLLRMAVEQTNNGEFWKAVQSLLSITVESAGVGTVERAALRAARIVRDHFSAKQAHEVAPIIAQRLTEAGQENTGIRIQDALMSMHYNNDNEENSGEEVNQAEQLARRGEWHLALEMAMTSGSAATSKLAIRWATVLLQQPDTSDYLNHDDTLKGGVTAALAVLTRWGVGAQGSSALVPPLLARTSALPSPPFVIFRDLRNILHAIMLAVGTDSNGTKKLERMIEAAALLCIREACRTVSTLRPIALKTATALLRHTDLIAADNAFYEAGQLMKDAGRECEALVFLNRYLDFAEAADADLGDAAPLDHGDFGNTDFPQEIVLGGSTLTKQQHDDVREWVLAISLDQNVSQTLPVDSRNLYECCLGPGDAACILTGFPLTSRIVHFTNGRAANRDTWAKLQLHCSTEPASDAADCRRFITAWCGADDYNVA